MKNYLFLLLNLVLFTACEETNMLSSTLNNFNETDLEACQNSSCPKITVDYPVYNGEEAIATKINSKVDTYLAQSLHIGEGVSPNTKEWKEVARQFVNANKDLKTEFDLELNYEAKVSISESFRNGQLLTLEQNSYLFTGGAHGYGSIRFHHLDVLTGEELETKALFEDFEGFKSFAEVAFRKAQGLSEDSSINATGFWFEDDLFRLPETLGLSQEGIHLIYNPYDIASYADGNIEVTLDWQNVESYLSKIYFP